MELDEITGEAVDAAVKIHQKIGPSLLESVYEILLEGVLTQRGLHVQRQCSISFSYEGMQFNDAFRVDLVVERRVLVELAPRLRVRTWALGAIQLAHPHEPSIDVVARHSH